MTTEIETVISLSKHDRLNNGNIRIWTNDSVIVTKLNKYGIKEIYKHNYQMSLADFIFLPKIKGTKANEPQYYPNWLIPPNDNHDKETLVCFTRDERIEGKLFIFTEDEHFLVKCKKYNLPFNDNMFLSVGQFKAFSKRPKMTFTDEQREIKKLRFMKNMNRLPIIATQ